MSTVNIGDTLKITVTFRDWSDETSSGNPEDPTSVVVTLTNTDTNSNQSLTPVHTGTGIYYVNWTPDIAGNYRISFVGTFPDNSLDTVNQVFTVVTEPDPTTAIPLVADEVIIFAAGLSPLYAAPEELQASFEDASLFNIAEQIFIASSDVKDLLDLRDDDPIPAVVSDYVLAAAACSLSKVFNFAITDEVSFRLGDLSVVNKNYSKSIINRGNANGWCELAFALRREVLALRNGFRSAVKASRRPNPIPARKLRRFH